MEPKSTKSSSRVLVALCSVVLIAGIVLLILALTPKSTRVHLDLLVDRFSFVLRSLPTGENSDLFAPALRFTAIEWSGVDTVSATVVTHPEARRITWRPGLEESIVLSAEPAAAPFQVHLMMPSPGRLEILPSRHSRVAMFFTSSDERSRVIWSASVVARTGLGLQLPATFYSGRTAGTFVLAPDAPSAIVKGLGPESRVGLELSIKRLSRITSLDLKTGALTQSTLPACLSDGDKLLTAGERLVSVHCEPEGPVSELLLANDLNISDAAFYRMRGTGTDSWIKGGFVRFPGRERDAVEVPPDYLIAVEQKDPTLQLKSVDYLPTGQVRVLLVGELSSVRVGPTLSLMDETLPSCFAWLSTHTPASLIFGTLSAIVTGAIGIFELLGLSKRREGTGGP